MFTSKSRRKKLDGESGVLDTADCDALPYRCALLLYPVSFSCSRLRLSRHRLRLLRLSFSMMAPFPVHSDSAYTYHQCSSLAYGVIFCVKISQRRIKLYSYDADELEDCVSKITNWCTVCFNVCYVVIMCVMLILSTERLSYNSLIIMMLTVCRRRDVAIRVSVCVARQRRILYMQGRRVVEKVKEKNGWDGRGSKRV